MALLHFISLPQLGLWLSLFNCGLGVVLFWQAVMRVRQNKAAIFNRMAFISPALMITFSVYSVAFSALRAIFHP